jgi:ferredoxin-NADP reductase
MAQQKTARVAAVEELEPGVRRLALDVEPLGFVGGQYLIFDSGVTLADGKRAKRAYSIVSPDAEQARVEVCVKRLGDGPGSSFMHRLSVGDEAPFSGPWGKLLPDDARPRPTLIVATDTGITAALGLARGAKFAPQLDGAELIWLAETSYFLPEERVRAWLPAPLRFRRIDVPHVAGDARENGRLAAARAALDERIRRGPVESAFLAGDGALLWPLADELRRAGVAEGAVRLEPFWNNPAKRSA